MSPKVIARLPSLLCQDVIPITSRIVPFGRYLLANHLAFLNQKLWLVFPRLTSAFLLFIVIFIPASDLAQESRRSYSEYTCWLNGAFANGHAYSNTLDGRNYQLEYRYERLLYQRGPLAVRWVFEALPLVVVGDPRTGHGRRVYSYAAGGSPIGAQVNLVHYRRVEPFLTSGGGFLYFNHHMFGATKFNFTAQLGAGVQLFTSNRRTALDLGIKYHHISNANLVNHNPGMDSYMVFVGVSLFR